MMSSTLYIEQMNTPLGNMEITANNKAVISVYFKDMDTKTENKNDITTECKQQLEQYFASERTVFDLPLEHHGTDFQKQVWQALLDIPFGTVASYLNIAQAINNPKAIRAVGAANGKNPHTIIVPCHRIIGSNGTLTGYASGLERKSWLLEHESKGGLVLS